MGKNAKKPYAIKQCSQFKSCVDTLHSYGEYQCSAFSVQLFRHRNLTNIYCCCSQVISGRICLKWWTTHTNLPVKSRSPQSQLRQPVKPFSIGSSTKVASQRLLKLRKMRRFVASLKNNPALEPDDLYLSSIENDIDNGVLSPDVLGRGETRSTMSAISHASSSVVTGSTKYSTKRSLHLLNMADILTPALNLLLKGYSIAIITS